MLAFSEVLAIVLPLAATVASKFLQDWVTSHPATSEVIQFLNRLNLTATLPASPFWLSIKYHTQPSVPTGGFWGMLQAVLFYFVLTAAFFLVGVYLCQEILSLWFTDTYLAASNWKLFLGGLLFWNTMYVVRYGLFVRFTGLASVLATFPIKGTVGLLACAYLAYALTAPLAAPIRTPLPIGAIRSCFRDPGGTLGRPDPGATPAVSVHTRICADGEHTRPACSDRRLAGRNGVENSVTRW